MKKKRTSKRSLLLYSQLLLLGFSKNHWWFNAHGNSKYYIVSLNKTSNALFISKNKATYQIVSLFGDDQDTPITKIGPGLDTLDHLVRLFG